MIGGMPASLRIGDRSLMDNFCYIIGWEKRNNVNAKEYGCFVEN